MATNTDDLQVELDRILSGSTVPRAPRDPSGNAIDTSRPAIRNPDNSISTEETIGIEADGRFINIPTIVGGKRVSDEEAIRLWRGGQNKEVGSFNSRAERDAAATARSSAIGNVRPEAQAPPPATTTPGAIHRRMEQQPVPMPRTETGIRDAGTVMLTPQEQKISDLKENLPEQLAEWERAITAEKNPVKLDALRRGLAMTLEQGRQQGITPPPRAVALTAGVKPEYTEQELTPPGQRRVAQTRPEMPRTAIPTRALPEPYALQGALQPTAATGSDMPLGFGAGTGAPPPPDQGMPLGYYTGAPTPPPTVPVRTRPGVAPGAPGTAAAPPADTSLEDELAGILKGVTKAPEKKGVFAQAADWFLNVLRPIDRTAQEKRVKDAQYPASPEEQAQRQGHLDVGAMPGNRIEVSRMRTANIDAQNAGKPLPYKPEEIAAFEKQLLPTNALSTGERAMRRDADVAREIANADFWNNLEATAQRWDVRGFIPGAKDADVFGLGTSDIGPGWRSMLGGLFQWYGEKGMALLADNPRLTGLVDRETASKIFGQMADLGQAWVDEAKRKGIDIQGTLKPGVGARAAEGVVGSVAMMAPALLTGYLTKNPFSVIAIMSGQTGATSYGEARAEGLTHEQAGTYAMLQALVEGGTEYLPMKEFFKSSPNAGKWFLRFLAKEVPGEMLATTLQSAVDKISVKPEMTMKDFGNDMLTTILSAPVAAGAIATGHRAITKTPEGPDRQEILDKFREGIKPFEEAKKELEKNKPPEFKPTHIIRETGTPVVESRDEATGKVIPGEWLTKEGFPTKELSAQPIQPPEDNASIRVNDVPYDVSVVGKGSKEGWARLSDGQEVPINQFENLGDEAKVKLGIGEGVDLKTVKAEPGEKVAAATPAIKPYVAPEVLDERAEKYEKAAAQLVEDDPEANAERIAQYRKTAAELKQEAASARVATQKAEPAKEPATTKPAAQEPAGAPAAAEEEKPAVSVAERQKQAGVQAEKAEGQLQRALKVAAAETWDPIAAEKAAEYAENNKRTNLGNLLADRAEEEATKLEKDAAALPAGAAPARRAVALERAQVARAQADRLGALAGRKVQAPAAKPGLLPAGKATLEERVGAAQAERKLATAARVKKGRKATPELERALQAASGTFRPEQAEKAATWAAANKRTDVAELIADRAEDVAERAERARAALPQGSPNYAVVHAALQERAAKAREVANRLGALVGRKPKIATGSARAAQISAQLKAAEEKKKAAPTKPGAKAEVKKEPVTKTLKVEPKKTEPKKEAPKQAALTPAAPATPATPATPAVPAAPTTPTYVPTLGKTQNFAYQNRLRGGVASVKQMNEIAERPDYQRAAVSKAPETGAPLVWITGDTDVIPEAQRGRKSIVVIDGVRVPIYYAVVESGPVIASNRADGTKREEYFADPQPGEIRALNNARTAGLREAYMRGTADSYRQEMTEDDEHGIAPEVIKAMDRPILVRVYPEQTNAQIPNIGKKSQGATLEQGSLENALQDAEKITPELLALLDLGDTGDVSASSNRAFVQTFLKTIVEPRELGSLMEADGTVPADAAYDRIEKALFQKAYASQALTQLFGEARDPAIRQVLNALAVASPEMAMLATVGPELDIRPYVAEAAGVFLNAKRRGVNIDKFVKQLDYQMNPLVMEIVTIMAEFRNSPRKLGNALKAGAEWAQDAAREKDAQQMFGDAPTYSVDDVVKFIKQYTVDNYGGKDEGGGTQAPVAEGVQGPAPGGAESGAQPGLIDEGGGQLPTAVDAQREGSQGENPPSQAGDLAAEQERAPYDPMGNVAQRITSAITSLRQIARTFAQMGFGPGTTNLDLGGGRFDAATEALRAKGVTNLVFDPFNRSRSHNMAVVDALKQNEGADTVTINNVLNVIEEGEARDNVIRRAAKALKDGGTAVFQIYEGDGTGESRVTQLRSGVPAAWQEHRKTETYIPEIQRYFQNVTRRGNLIVATNPIRIEGETTWSGGPIFQLRRELQDRIEALAAKFDAEGDTYNAMKVRNLRNSVWPGVEDQEAQLNIWLKDFEAVHGALVPFEQRRQAIVDKFEALGLEQEAQTVARLQPNMSEETRWKNLADSLSNPLPETMYGRVIATDAKRLIKTREIAEAAVKLQSHDGKYGKFRVQGSGDGFVIKVLAWPGGVTKATEGTAPPTQTGSLFEPSAEEVEREEEIDDEIGEDEGEVVAPRTSKQREQQARERREAAERARVYWERQEKEYREKFKVGDTVNFFASVADVEPEPGKVMPKTGRQYVSGNKGKIERIDDDYFYVRTHVYGTEREPLMRLKASDFDEQNEENPKTYEQWRDAQKKHHAKSMAEKEAEDKAPKKKPSLSDIADPEQRAKTGRVMAALGYAGFQAKFDKYATLMVSFDGGKWRVVTSNPGGMVNIIWDGGDSTKGQNTERRIMLTERYQRFKSLIATLDAQERAKHPEFWGETPEDPDADAPTPTVPADIPPPEPSAAPISSDPVALAIEKVGADRFQEAVKAELRKMGAQLDLLGFAEATDRVAAMINAGPEGFELTGQTPEEVKAQMEAEGKVPAERKPKEGPPPPQEGLFDDDFRLMQDRAIYEPGTQVGPLYQAEQTPEQYSLTGEEETENTVLNLARAFGRDGARRLYDIVMKQSQGASEEFRSALFMTLARLELASHALTGQGRMILTERPNEEAEALAASGVLEIDRLHQYFPENDPIWDLQNGGMKAMLRVIILNTPAFAAAHRANPMTESLTAADKNPVVRVEFEGANVWGTVGEGIGYKFGMGGETPKSKWGELKRVVAIQPDDYLHPTRLTYFPTESNQIRQRQATRNELKILLGADGPRLVGAAADLSKSEFLFGKAIAPKGAFMRGETGAVPGATGPLHLEPIKGERYAVATGLANAPMFTGGEKGFNLYANDVETIIRATRMSPDQFWEAVRNGNTEHLKTVVRPNARRTAKANRTWMIPNRDLTPANAETIRAQLDQAWKRWEDIGKGDPRAGQHSLFQTPARWDYEASTLIEQNGWGTVEEARSWMTDDRSHGDETLMEAANDLYEGEDHGRSTDVLPYVAASLARADALRQEEGEPPTPTTFDDAAQDAQGHLATPAQQTAGNYAKGHVMLNPDTPLSMAVTVENMEGTRRHPDWEPLQDHYGYFPGTVGFDKGSLDVFVNHGTTDDWIGPVFIVNQYVGGRTHPITGRTQRKARFDEHKVMLGYGSLEEARAAYQRNYPAGWSQGKTIIELAFPAFKAWAQDDGPYGPKGGELTEETARALEVYHPMPAMPAKPTAPVYDVPVYTAPVGPQSDLFDAQPVAGTGIQAFEKVIVEPKTQGFVQAPGGLIKNEVEAAQAFQQLRKYARERFQVLILDKNGKPLSYFDGFAGALMVTSVYPREVALIVAQTPGAAQIWVAHNHPSGSATPSGADRDLTKALTRLFLGTGVAFQGHVVIARDTASLIRNDTVVREGFDVPPMGIETQTVPVMEREVLRDEPRGPKITTADELKQYLRDLNPPDTGVLVMDAQNRPIAWWPMSTAEMSKLRTGDVTTGVQKLFRMVGRNNPASAVVYAPQPVPVLLDFQQAADNLARAFNAVDVVVVDAIYSTGNTPAGPALTSVRGTRRGPIGGGDRFRSLSPEPVVGRMATKAGIEAEIANVPLRKKLGDKVVVVQNPYELPLDVFNELVKDGVVNIVRGHYSWARGKVYLVASNMREGHGTQVLLHEAVGHMGIIDVMERKHGLDLMEAFLDIYRKRSADIRREATTGFLAQYDLDLRNQMSQATAAAEWIAHQAEDGKELGLWRRIVGAIRNALRGSGFGQVKEWTDNDIRYLLHLSRLSLMQGGANTVNGMPATLASLVWSGSPAAGFNKFDLRYIDTGTGAQAQGWGLYFGTQRDVAEHYANLETPLVKMEQIKTLQDRRAQAASTLTGARRVEALRRIDAALEGLTKGTGTLYKVELAPGENEYLYWDRHLSEQPPQVQAAIQKMASENGIDLSGDMGGGAKLAMNGKGVYLVVVDHMLMHRPEGTPARVTPEELASRLLASYGVPGIKYLDQGSRGQQAEQKTYNYVVFDDKLIKIIERRNVLGQLYSLRDLFSGLVGKPAEPTPTPEPVPAAPAAPTTISTKAGVDFRRLNKLLGAKLYGEPKDIATVSVKEMFQNSFDALKALIDTGAKQHGTIAITINPVTRTITLKDDGSGMEPDILATKFLQVASTQKESERSSGGLGIAKGLFLYGNERIVVNTVRNGQMASLDTTGAALEDAAMGQGEAPQITITPTSEPSGTTVSVTIPKSYVEAMTGNTINIELPTYRDAYHVLEKSPLFSNIDVTFNGDLVENIGSTFNADDYSVFANVTFKWGTARVYVGKQESPGTYGLNAHVLSNGLWQFSLTATDNPYSYNGKRIPRQIYIDVDAKVKPEDPGYPFELNRQSFAQTVAKDFDQLFAYLGMAYQVEKAEDMIANFGKVQYYDGTTPGPMEDLTPPRPKESKGKRLSVVEGDTVKVVEGKLIVNGRKIPELTRESLKAMEFDVTSLKIDQKKVKHTKVMLHDNVQFPDGTLFSEQMRKEMGPRFDGFVTDLGYAFHALRSWFVTQYPNRYGAAGATASSPSLEDFAVGISFDKEYHGVHTQAPFRGIFINPATLLDMTAEEAGNEIFGTMIHEIVHLLYKDHDAAFVNELQRFYSRTAADPMAEAIRLNIVNTMLKSERVWPRITEAFQNEDLSPVGRSIQEQKSGSGSGSGAGPSKRGVGPGTERVRDEDGTGLGQFEQHTVDTRVSGGESFPLRPLYSLRAPEPTRVQEVYGVKDGRLLGLASRATGSDLWNVYLANGTNETLFAQGEFRREQAGSINEVNRIFSANGLELNLIKPAQIPVPQTTIFDTDWVAPKIDNWFKRTIRYLQNRLLLPEEYEKAIARQVGAIPENAKVHREARLASARGARAIADFDHDFTERLVAVMKRHRLTLKDVGLYLYALHAPERNAQIELRNPETVNGSGISDTKAAEILAALKAKGVLEILEREVKPITDGIRAFREQVLIDRGLADEKIVRYLRETYPNYVPLKDIIEDEFAQQQITPGFEVSRPFQTAFGRWNEAQADYILPGLIAQAKGTLMAAEHAEVGRSLLRLAAHAPNPNVWNLQKYSSRPSIDPDTGMVRFTNVPVMRNSKLAPRAISVPLAGDRHVLVMEDQNLAQAFKTSGLPVPEAIRLMGNVTRFYALLATAANPEFVMVNLMRDFQQAMIRLTGENNPALAAKVAKDMMPALWGALAGIRSPEAAKGARQATAYGVGIGTTAGVWAGAAIGGPIGAAVGGATAGPALAVMAAKWGKEWHPWHTRFEKAGGAVTYRGMYDTETQHKDFLTALAEIGLIPEGATGIDKARLRSHFVAKKLGMKAFHKLIMDVNGAVENALRLSAFKNAIESGMNDKDAAMLARTVTVDFALKGEGTAWMGSLWMFINANVQGNMLLARSVINHRGIKAIAMVLLFLAMGLDWWNRHWAKKTEDGRNHYDNISASVKERNLVIMGPDQEHAILIPLPLGFNIFYNAGINLMSVIDGAKKPTEAAKDTFVAVANAFNVLGQTPSSWLGALQFIAPTPLDPWVQAMTNRNWMDQPVAPERSKTATPQARAETYFGNPPEHWLTFSRFLNETIGGGNEVRSGSVLGISTDISPNMLQHWAHSMFGSAGAFYSRAAEGIYMGIRGEPIEMKDTPFLRRFYYDAKDYELSHRFYENMNQTEIAYWEVRRAAESGRPELAQALAEEFQPERQLHGTAQDAERRIADLSAAKSRIRRDRNMTQDQKQDALDKLNEQSTLVMQQFNRRYDEFTAR